MTTLVLTKIADNNALCFAIDGDDHSGLAFVHASPEQAAACRNGYIGATVEYDGTVTSAPDGERTKLVLDPATPVQLAKLVKRVRAVATGMPA